MKSVSFKTFSKTVITLAVANALFTPTVFAAEEKEAAEKEGEFEKIMVTANRQSQSLQEVSSSITAVGDEDIERAGIVDITGLESVVPGLKVGSSGGEVRPAMRGARTNEVGVAGTGIAEQVVGIFQDGIYVPTTTAGLGAFVDIERIEVLRGPQGTLYGRNTFAGSINVITKQPEMDSLEGNIKITTGAYNRSAYEGVLNLPISDNVATRFVVASDRHDGVIENHVLPGPSDDLREKNQFYARSVTRYEPSDDFNFTVRFDYSKKDANSEAIWGYQQIAGYQISETSPGSGVFNPNATVTPGHIYQPGSAQRDDLGPYDVYRNAFSWDKQETFSATTVLEYYGSDFADIKWTTNYSKLSGTQFYDNDYSDGGLDFVGGFGRLDDQKNFSTELQLSSNHEGPLQWIAGLYYYDQEADWAWLWREDTTGDGNADSINVPGWGNPDYDPHTVDSIAVFGQLRYELSDDLRLVGGLRYNKDEKTFTGDSIPDWDDSAVLWKAAVEYDYADDTMIYASAATGYRTGGANDGRVVSRGAEPLYDNEEVISYEVGVKTMLLDGSMRFNASAFINEYDDVKAQLFAVACNDASIDTILDCVAQGSATTFEYYENGGGIESIGAEVEIQWYPTDGLSLTSSLAYLDSEFSDDYAVGNSELRPLLGLGNLEGRQDVNDNNSQFSFKGWSPAMSPEYTLGLAATYEFELGEESYLIPHLSVKYSDDYYAFDTNIDEVKVDAHAIVNARMTYIINENVQVDFFIQNATDKEVLTRGVVHSQIVNGAPANSVQANWNNPRTWGASFKYSFM